jgi:benzoyl-CoA-dihydrodiol lyase
LFTLITDLSQVGAHDTLSKVAVSDPESMIAYRTAPSSYKHWQLDIEASVAYLRLNVDEKAGLTGDYQLKLNTYDLGADIELSDAVQRLRFEHPSVRVVVLVSANERVFSPGANIAMLSAATHSEKMNFCKFPNETRNSIKDATEHSS